MLVKNKAGAVLRTVSFRYGYFTNGGTGVDNKRLKLSGVYINGGSSTDTLKAQRYNLLYNPGALAIKGTLAQDHWGYYNGADGNSTLLPSYSNCVDAPTPPTCYSCTGQPGILNFVGANRSSNGTYASFGMLERMILPTGGYAQYEWEPHDAINFESTTTYQNTAIGSATSSSTSTTFRTDSSADYYINPSNTPVGICGTLTGRMTIPSSSIDDEALITHASGQVSVYKRAGRVLVANINFDYSPTNQYNLSTNFSLESGQSYFVVTRVRQSGFSVVGNMRANIPTTVTPPNRTVGGCRIKRITLQDPVAGKSIVKSYDYRIPDDTIHSSGRVRREPVYSRNVIRFESDGPEHCQFVERYGVQLSSNSLVNLGSGNHVNYTYVKETTGQASVNGYTLYNYANNNSQSEFTPTWRSGYLLAKTVYNNVSQPVSKERYVYSTDSRGDSSFIGSTVTYYVKHTCANDTILNQFYPSYGGGKDWLFQSEWFHLDSSITETYDSDMSSRVLVTSNAITYDNVKHLQASKKIEKNSENLDLITIFRYPQDYTLPLGTLSQEAQAIIDMQAANIHTPVEVYSQKKLASGVLQTQSAVYMGYKSLSTTRGPVVLFDKQYEAEITFPSGTFTSSAVSGTSIVKNASYSLKGTAVLYDQANNIIETEKRGGNVDAYIWDYNRSYVVAQFKNARQADVAFSSFEADGKGNWTYAGANVSDATTLTGKSSYSLASGAVVKTGLTSSNTYTVSYWTKNSTAYSITGTVSGYPLKGTTINGWTYFEHKVTGVPSVSLSGTGQIDELRLYPATASAITYTYEALVGVTSVCNESNKTTYFSYDSDGRLTLVKDQNGKILKQADYQYQASINK